MMRQRSYGVMAVLAMLLAGGVTAYAQQPSLLTSQGKIHNVGTIKVYGDAALKQDSIGGMVQYLRNHAADTQLVAHTTYDSVYFEGQSRKILKDVTRPLVAASLFSSADTLTVFDMVAATHIEAHGRLMHEGLINPGRRDGTVMVNGAARQEISGEGLVPVLEVDNAQGVDVTRGGGLRIVERLDLQDGQVLNTASDNLAMQRDAWIWRSDKGSIAQAPGTDQRLNLRYYGLALTRGGAEMLRTATVLQKLHQDNPGGVELPWDVTINDSLVLRGHIFTELDTPTAVSSALRYTSATLDPVFVGLWPEINGRMVRTSLVPGRRMVMNSTHNFIRFERDADMGSVRMASVRVKPSTVPLPTSQGVDKVRRFYQMDFQDATGITVPDSTYVLEFGYAWRSDSLPSVENAGVIETIPALVIKIDSLALERFIVDKYATDGISTLPTQSDDIWRYSSAHGIRSSGDFAIGLSSFATVWVMRARVYLEGAMRSYADNLAPVMATDLRQRNLVPTTPPNEYPYTLDPLRSAIVVPTLPDSIVDWMIVEFRTSISSSSAVHYQTALLTRNGYVVDPVTFLPLPIRSIRPGDYYIVFRHRNHLAVMTQDAETVAPSNVNRALDFTTGLDLFGGAASMKLLGVADGRRWFGMVAGNVDHDDDVRRIDHNLIWDNRDIEGFSLFDTDLDGIISTKDWNVSWNNRGRSSAVPR